MDSGLESGVHVGDTVGSEKQDAFVVFQRAQEDRDELVSLEVVGGALLEEDVALVEQENGVPLRDHLEDVLQRVFDLVRPDS